MLLGAVGLFVPHSVRAKSTAAGSGRRGKANHVCRLALYRDNAWEAWTLCGGAGVVLGVSWPLVGLGM